MCARVKQDKVDTSYVDRSRVDKGEDGRIKIRETGEKRLPLQSCVDVVGVNHLEILKKTDRQH